jgi:hypothetical protein
VTNKNDLIRALERTPGEQVDLIFRKDDHTLLTIEPTARRAAPRRLAAPPPSGPKKPADAIETLRSVMQSTGLSLDDLANAIDQLRNGASAPAPAPLSARRAAINDALASLSRSLSNTRLPKAAIDAALSKRRAELERGR